MNRATASTIGIISIILGAIAIALPFLSSLAVAVYIGILLIVGGLLQAFYAFANRTAAGGLWRGMMALIFAIAGVLIFTSPLTGLVAITVALAVFFLLEGLIKLASMGAAPGGARGWLGFSGALSLILAVLIFANLPGDAAWIPGVFLGIDLVVNGAAFLIAPGAASAPGHGRGKPRETSIRRIEAPVR